MNLIAEITEMELRLLQAMESSDTKELNELISEELIFTNHMGQILTKEADIQSHRSGLLKIGTLSASRQAIIPLKEAAVVTVLITLEGSFSGTPFKGTFRYTRVWRKKEDRWQVIAGHCTEVKE